MKYKFEDPMYNDYRNLKFFQTEYLPEKAKPIAEKFKEIAEMLIRDGLDIETFRALDKLEVARVFGIRTILEKDEASVFQRSKKQQEKLSGIVSKEEI